MLGYAAFDSDRTAWHYTAKGAVALGVRHYFKGMRRELVPDKDLPADR